MYKTPKIRKITNCLKFLNSLKDGSYVSTVSGRLSMDLQGTLSQLHDLKVLSSEMDPAEIRLI
jgi:hypothetical protein